MAGKSIRWTGLLLYADDRSLEDLSWKILKRLMELRSIMQTVRGRAVGHRVFTFSLIYLGENKRRRCGVVHVDDRFAKLFCQRTSSCGTHTRSLSIIQRCVKQTRPRLPASHLDGHAARLLRVARGDGVPSVHGGHRPPLQAQGLVPAAALAAVPLLLLPVLHLHQGRDERVLHLFIELQLLAPSQLADQLPRVLEDGGLYPLQQLDEHRAGHQAQACRGGDGGERDGRVLFKSYPSDIRHKAVNHWS